MLLIKKRISSLCVNSHCCSKIECRQEMHVLEVSQLVWAETLVANRRPASITWSWPWWEKKPVQLKKINTYIKKTGIGRLPRSYKWLSGVICDGRTESKVPRLYRLIHSSPRTSNRYAAANGTQVITLAKYRLSWSDSGDILLFFLCTFPACVLRTDMKGYARVLCSGCHMRNRGWSTWCRFLLYQLAKYSIIISCYLPPVGLNLSCEPHLLRLSHMLMVSLSLEWLWLKSA